MAQFSVYPAVPVSITGSIAATQSGIWSMRLQDGSGNVINSTSNALWVNLQASALVGQAAMAASIPVVIASNQSTLVTSDLADGPVSAGAAASKSMLIGGVFNTVLPTVTNGQQVALQLDSSGRLIIAPLTNSSIIKAQLQDNAGTAITVGQKAMASSVPVVIASDQSAITISPLTNSSIVKAQLQDNAGTAITLGQKTMASSVPVTIASDQSAVPASQSGTWTVQPGNTANTTAWLVKEQVSATATLTNVSGSASSVSLLASNANRLGATFFNDSTAILYLKFGTTASTTSYTVQIASNGYYELPGPRIYSGAIDGIWSAANGAVRITELT